MSITSSSKRGPSSAWWPLLLLLILAAGGLVATPLSSAVARARMEAFHLASPSWEQWAPWQLVPAMYSFSNFGQLTHVPELDAERHEGFRLNHYPAQLLTFHERNVEMLQKYQRYLVLESNYRGQKVQTVHELGVKDGPEGASAALHVERYMPPAVWDETPPFKP
jgi:hypothetical protein